MLTFTSPSVLPSPRRVHFSPPNRQCTLLASPLRHRQSSRTPHSRGSLNVRASQDAYKVLGVSKQATSEEIKRAFKKKALKLHPDVNSAPDAKDRFMECKQAYEAIANAEERQRYDRKQQGGGNFWEDLTSGGPRRRGQMAKGPEEAFYSLGDFWKDLEKDIDKRWGEAGPKSLWEELKDLGEELVDFLEQGIDDKGKGPTGSSAAGNGSASSGSSGGRAEAKPPPPRGPTAAELEERAERARRAAEESKRRAEEEIEETIKKMKEDLKLR